VLQQPPHPFGDVSAPEAQRAKAGIVFGDAVDQYIIECETKSEPDAPNTIKAKKAGLKRPKAAWANRRLCEITKKDIEDLLEEIEKGQRKRTRNGKTDGARVMAFFVRAHLKTFFRWTVLKKEWMVADPTERLREISKPDERERVLSEDEIRRFWRACDRVGYPFGPALQLLLLTGQRKNEVAGLHRDELNMDKRQWTIPRHRTKNRRTHIVPLSQFAIEIIESLPHYKSGFLFSGDGENSVKDFQHVKEDLDLLMKTGIHSLDPCDEHWVIHDLRRTATTGMAGLEVREEVADKVLNHVGGKISGVKRIYNRFQYLNERREALEKWASYVRGLVDERWSGVSQNVSQSNECQHIG
jgi:integrase